MDILEHLKKLEAAATPGPWVFDDSEGYRHDYDISAPTGTVCYQKAALGKECSPDYSDAQLISAMRNALPVLLELAERVEVLDYPDECREDESYQALLRSVEKLRALKGNTHGYPESS